MESQKKRPRGRPRYVPAAQDKALVLALVGSGLSLDETRQNVLGPNGKPISERTFRRVFAEEIRNARGRFRGLLVRRYVKFLNSPDERVALRATEIGLRAHAGWVERSGVEVSGPGGEPLRVGVEHLTADEIAAETWKVLRPYLARRLADATPPLPAGALPPLGLDPEAAWALIEKSNLEPYRQLEAWSAWNRRNAGIEAPGDRPAEAPLAADTPLSKSGEGVGSQNGGERRHDSVSASSSPTELKGEANVAGCAFAMDPYRSIQRLKHPLA